jgi:hypothetical protein
MIEEQRQVASTMLAQIGRMNLMAIGAREFQAYDDQRGALRMKVNRSEWVEVVLTDDDLYDITHFRINRSSHERVILHTSEGIFDENLGEAIYRMTQQT